MKLFKTIIISDKTEVDIQNTVNHIRNVYGQETTASNYKSGLYKTIGTIIFFIEDDCVYIRCVIPSSMIH